MRLHDLAITSVPVYRFALCFWLQNNSSLEADPLQGNDTEKYKGNLYLQQPQAFA